MKPSKMSHCISIALLLAATVACAEARFEKALHRTLGILNYVIGDYAVAVDHRGEIINAFEYDEQVTLLHQVREHLQPIDPDLTRKAEDLSASIDRQEPSQQVVAEARSLRDEIITKYDLQLGPSRLPSLAQGRELYRQACAACHGPYGRARTAIAEQLQPRPTDLLARHLDERLSPYQVFNIVSFGVPQTAMPSFEVLSEEERWDLAFFVTAMRQRAIPKKPGRTLSPSLEFLARVSDAELRQWLAQNGVPPEERASLASHLRRLASSFEAE